MHDFTVRLQVLSGVYPLQSTRIRCAGLRAVSGCDAGLRRGCRGAAAAALFQHQAQDCRGPGTGPVPRQSGHHEAEARARELRASTEGMVPLVLPGGKLGAAGVANQAAASLPIEEMQRHMRLRPGLSYSVCFACRRNTEVRKLALRSSRNDQRGIS